MYDWEVRRVRGSQLESTLEAASAGGWEVFSVVAAGDDPAAPPEDRVLFAVIVRRPRQRR
jgi:hypothetical protein